jgi:hypothetical protein
MSLEELEKELYEINKKSKQRKQVFATAKTPVSEPVIQEDWPELEFETETKEKSPKRPLSRAALIAIIVVSSLAVIAGAIAFIATYDKEPQKIRLEMISPSEVRRGEPFEVDVEITNSSPNFIRQANLNLSIPSGLIYLSGFNDGRSAVVSELVGDIGSGSFSKKTFRFLPVGPINSLGKLKVTLTYSTGDRTRYEVSASKDVTISSPAITLDIKKPERILRGAPLELDLHYKNESPTDFPDVAIELRYPGAFKYKSASLTPDRFNNYWRLGELKAGSAGDLQVRGVFEDSGETSFSIPITIYVTFLGKDYVVFEELVTIKLASSPIAFEILLNRKSDYIAELGDTLNYTLRYENRSGIALTDVVIKATLAGELFDFESLRTKANIDSLTNTLTWNASNEPQLKILDPGAAGEVSFSITLARTFSIKRLSDKNYILRVQAQIDSPSVPYYLEAPKTSAFALLETKVAGFVTLDAKVFYRDAKAGIANAGTLPPRVNQPTEYTVHWIIKNYSTDLRDIKINAYLESGVVMTGIVKSNVDTVPLYNERTQEITWEIPKIPATKGVISDPVEAIFQIRATPNITQVNQFQPLLSESVLLAIDDFTGLKLSSRDEKLTTALPDDPTIGESSGKVVQ